ncbi:MAG: DUF4398 domain-containing protein [Povalibacter sp.]
MRALQSLLVSATLVASIGALTGCGGVSDLTKENVNRSETAVLQAQRAIGSSEYGAIELQRARDHLAAAKTAVADGNDKAASHAARDAQLDSELAVAKSQSAASRKAADELTASINTLREEAARSSR